MGGAGGKVLQENNGLYEGKETDNDTPRSPTKPKGAGADSIFHSGGDATPEPVGEGRRKSVATDPVPIRVATFFVGDIVEVADSDPDSALFFEGVITERNADGTYSVQYPGEEMEEHVDDRRVRKVSGWDDLFKGDTVRVKDKDMPSIQCEAIVERINADGTFDVVYPIHDGEDEEEKGVVRENIVKIGTHHLSGAHNWSRLRHVVQGLMAFKMAGAGGFKALAAAAKDPEPAAEEDAPAAEGEEEKEAAE